MNNWQLEIEAVDVPLSEGLLLAKTMGEMVGQAITGQLEAAVSALDGLTGKLFYHTQDALRRGGDAVTLIKSKVNSAVQVPLTQAENLLKQIEGKTGIDYRTLALSPHGQAGQIDHQSGLSSFNAPSSASPGPSGPLAGGGFPLPDQPPPPGGEPGECGFPGSNTAWFLVVKKLPDGSCTTYCACRYYGEGFPDLFKDEVHAYGPFTSALECSLYQPQDLAKWCGGDDGGGGGPPPPPESCVDPPDLSCLEGCIISCSHYTTPPGKPAEHDLVGVRCCPGGGAEVWQCRIKGVPDLACLDPLWNWFLDGSHIKGPAQGSLKEVIERCSQEPTCGIPPPPPPPPPPDDGGDGGGPPPSDEKKKEGTLCIFDDPLGICSDEEMPERPSTKGESEKIIFGWL